MGVFTIGLGHSHHTSSKKPSEVVGNGKCPNLGCPIPGRDFLPKVPNGSLGLTKYMHQSLDLDVGMLEVINGCFWDLLYFAQDGSLLALGGFKIPWEQTWPTDAISNVGKPLVFAALDSAS